MKTPTLTPGLHILAHTNIYTCTSLNTDMYTHVHIHEDILTTYMHTVFSLFDFPACAMWFLDSVYLSTLANCIPAEPVFFITLYSLFCACIRKFLQEGL